MTSAPMKDKVFTVQLFEKGTRNIIAVDVLVTRDTQMKLNEKKLVEIFNTEVEAATKKLLKNPQAKEMLLN